MADWYKQASLGDGSEPPPLTTTSDKSTPPPTPKNKNDISFTSRRSAVVCRHAAVATSQPLASDIGLSILKDPHANAADAAVAMAAALAVLEPCSTGLGGDMFCLYYDAASRKVSCINGSGRSPAGLTRELLQQQYPKDDNTTIDAERFCYSPHAVTVPGAAQGWHDLWQRHGSGHYPTMAPLLEPAAQLADEGFPVAPITAHHWTEGFAQISKWYDKDTTARTVVPLPLVKWGTTRTPPSAGDIVVNHDLARVLRDLGQHGPQHGFYQHAVTATALVDIVQEHGGCLTLDDLAAHTSSTFPEPIAAEYRGYRLWQVPPNGQGVAALIALQGLQHLEQEAIQLSQPLTRASLDTADGYHVLMELMRLGFADARAYVADDDDEDDTKPWYLDAQRNGTRAAQLFDPTRAVMAGVPDPASCTVSFQVVDRHGNAVSFVNSNFMGFGTGLVPKKCGFTLQNRGFGFALDDPSHPNAVAPNKRPYHTIIPGLLTHADTEELYATLSNMGGNMQPQGHLQLTVAMVAGGYDPQTAIDRPRFCIADGTHDGVVFMEEGIEDAVVKELQRRGHLLRANVRGHDRSLFGRAQIIRRDRATGVLWAGSDGRSDGCAMGY